MKELLITGVISIIGEEAVHHTVTDDYLKLVLQLLIALFAIIKILLHRKKQK